MKALQIKYEAAKRKAGDVEDLEPVALLDGGATHALRQARSHEKSNLTAAEVELACGSTVLYKHPGTSALLTLDPVEPITPLRMLVNAGFVVKWNAKVVAKIQLVAQVGLTAVLIGPGSGTTD